MKRLLKNQYLYKAIFENSMDAILLTSPDGKIHHVNEATCTMFKRTEQEICEIGREGLIDFKDLRLNKLLQERAISGKARGELTFIRGDGTKFPGEVTSVIFKDDRENNWSTIIIRDISIFKEAEETLKRNHEEAIRLAMYDSLTDLLNRRGFMERLQEELERSRRDETQIGLVIVDIDLFKKVNDSYGHLTGDYVLQKMAQCLSENIRVYDILGRYGGEEFIVGLPNSNLSESMIIAERMRAQVEKLDIFHNHQKIKVTASFGVACCSCSECGENIDAFISRADNAMYKAKLKRNLVCSDSI